MTSLQHPKTKLQPLYYSSKNFTNDLDVEKDPRIPELFGDIDLASDSSQEKEKENSTKRKPFKSLKASLYQNIVSSEGVISSDDELVFANMLKTNLPSKNGSIHPVSENKKGSVESSKVLKSIHNHALTPNKTGIPENTKEEDGERQESMKKGNGNSRAGKHNRCDSGDQSNKENIENYNSISINHPRQKPQPKSAEKSPYKGSIMKLRTIDFDGNKGQRVEEEPSNSNKKKNIRITEILNRGMIEDNLPVTKSRHTVGVVRGTLEENPDYTVRKGVDREIYIEVIREIQSMSLESDSNRHIMAYPQGASKEEKATLKVIEQRLGKDYAERLYELFVQYCCTKETKKKTMTLGKLLLFMRNYEIFEGDLTREAASLFFIKRCPGKFADFAGFVDILYKLHKCYDYTSTEEIPDDELSPFSKKDRMFQNYLRTTIFEKKINPLLSIGGSLSNISLMEPDSWGHGLDYQALKILEDNDEVFRKIFRKFWPWNSKYQGWTSDSRKNIVLLKDFKEFCYNYGIVPNLCSLGQAIGLFRRFQKEGEEVIDYKGFINILCYIANIGFSKEPMAHKFDTFAKRLTSLCHYLVQMSHIAPERSHSTIME